MEVKYLALTDETKANEISSKVSDFSDLLKDQEKIEESPFLVEGIYYVTYLEGMSLEGYENDIVNTLDLRPDLKEFSDQLQVNYDREEDGRALVKQMITILDKGVGGYPHSAISGLFKEMGWVRALLKEGFFETGFYEFSVVFSPKNLLPPETLADFQSKIFDLAKKYNSSFDGTVS